MLVDGAHALGMLPLDLADLAPDYFVSNCHKWLCGARGSAMLYVARGRRDGIRPLVVSHGSGAGFTSDFVWDGASCCLVVLCCCCDVLCCVAVHAQCAPNDDVFCL